MKILYVIDGLAGGGAEKLLNDLLPIFEKSIHCDVLILSETNAKYRESLENNGIDVFCIPTEEHGLIQQIKFIQKFILTRKYDIVHANLFPAIYYCSLARKLSGKRFPKLVMTEHSTDNKRRHLFFLRPIEKYIYSSYLKIISISSDADSAIKKWLHESMNSDRFCVIENGILLTVFSSAKPYRKKHLIQSYKNSDILLCVVGALKPIKNHKRMLNVLMALPKRYKLLIVGEGPLKETLEIQVKDNNIEHRVSFLGFRTDIPQILASSDIVVVPSIWEGFGLVAVEAMATGTPVVVSDVPGLSSIVGTAGLKANTDEDFVTQIRSLENSKCYKKYQEKALVKAKQYDLYTTKNKYEMLYNEIMDNVEKQGI